MSPSNRVVATARRSVGDGSTAPTLYRTSRRMETAAVADVLASAIDHPGASHAMLSVVTAAPTAKSSRRSSKFGVDHTLSAAPEVSIRESVVRSSGIATPPGQTSRPHTLAEIAHAIADQLDAGQSVESLNDLAQTFRYTTRLADAMLELIDLESEPGMAWLWLAHWVAERHADSGASPAVRPLRDFIDDLGVSPALLAQIKTILDRRLGQVDPTSWRTPRAQRLARYLETL